MFVEFGNVWQPVQYNWNWGYWKDIASFQALQKWIGHNATRYHNFNALPQALPYIFSQFNMDMP